MYNNVLRRSAKGALSLSLILLLAACAIPPDLGDAPKPRADLTVAGEKPADRAAFPQGDWWQRYDDPQLSLLIEEATRQSPTLIEAMARVTKAAAVAQQQGAGLWPSLSATGSYTKTKQSYYNAIDPAYVPHGLSDQAHVGLNFSYEVDFWGRNRDNADAALTETEAAALQAEQARILLETNVAAAYADLSQAYADLDVARQSSVIRTQTEKLFEQRHKQGLENDASVEQAKSNRAIADADVAAIQEQIDLTKNRIAALMGAMPQRAISISRPFVENIDGLGMPKFMPADLIAQRPDLKASLLIVQAAAKRIHVAKAGFYPNVNLSAMVGLESLSLDTFAKRGSLLASFGPAVHLPLFEGGQLEGAYRGARADYEIAVAQYNGAIVQALREVADVKTSQKALTTRTAFIQQALDAAERAYGKTQDRYKGGLATYLEVLRAEDSLLTLRRSLADIHARAFTLDVALVKALGGGFSDTTEQEDK